MIKKSLTICLIMCTAVFFFGCSPRLSDLAVSEGTLEPSFNPNILNYKASIAYSTEEISITAVPENTAATFTMASNRVMLSGDICQLVRLRPGENNISITVTLDNNQNVYNIAVTRDYEESSTFFQDLQTALDDAYDTENLDEMAVVGVSAAVFTPDKGTWYGASGLNNITIGDELAPDMMLCVGSITKTYIAALALKLTEDSGYGFSLDDTVSDWMTEGELPDSSIIHRGITVKQLLYHTSGLRDELTSYTGIEDLFAAIGYLRSPEEVIMTYTEPPGSEPGESFDYANINYTLVGIILQNVLQIGDSETTVSGELRKRFFIPLNLQHTFYTGEENPGPGLAKGHHYLGDRFVPNFIMPDKELIKAANFAGSIVSTPEELARWAEALYMRMGENEGSEILSKTSLDMMMTKNEFDKYGLGLKFYPDGSIGHGGSSIIYSAFMHFNPETGVTVVGLFNDDDILYGYHAPNRTYFYMSLLDALE